MLFERLEACGKAHIVQNIMRHMDFSNTRAESEDLWVTFAGAEFQRLGEMVLPWSFWGADFNRRFLTARQYNTHTALKQFQEASQFRREKHIVKLHDLVEITDFEQARQFVRLRVSSPK